MEATQAAIQLATLVTTSQTKLQRARVWLLLTLAAGPELATVLFAGAAEEGFSKTTLLRAAKGLVSKRHEKRFSGQWFWELREKLDTTGVDDAREALVKRLLELMK
jgi:hypothetical protein